MRILIKGGPFMIDKIKKTKDLLLLLAFMQSIAALLPEQNNQMLSDISKLTTLRHSLHIANEERPAKEQNPFLKKLFAELKALTQANNTDYSKKLYERAHALLERKQRLAIPYLRPDEETTILERYIDDQLIARYQHLNTLLINAPIPAVAHPSKPAKTPSRLRTIPMPAQPTTPIIAPTPLVTPEQVPAAVTLGSAELPQAPVKRKSIREILEEKRRAKEAADRLAREAMTPQETPAPSEQTSAPASVSKTPQLPPVIPVAPPLPPAMPIFERATAQPKSTSRSGLLEQISKETTLKPMQPRTTKPAPTQGREGLLEQIRSGKTLRSVEQAASEQKPAVAKSGIQSALEAALAARRGSLEQEPEEESDEDWEEE